MNKYIGPKVKLIRRLSELPGLTNKKIKNRSYAPGEHGFLEKNILKTEVAYTSQYYLECLLDKQKIKYNYGITDNKLFLYYKYIINNKKIKRKKLLEFLENRLDCIVFRLGFTKSITSAKQLINHNHIKVNNKIINFSNFICKKNDIITFINNKNNNIKNLILKNLIFFEKKKK